VSVFTTKSSVQSFAGLSMLDVQRRGLRGLRPAQAAILGQFWQQPAARSQQPAAMKNFIITTHQITSSSQAAR
jgi:hypothetical protein